MHKLILITAVLALVVPASASFYGHGYGWDGGGIDNTRVTGYWSGHGGEFTIQPDNDPNAVPFKLDNSAYAASTKGADGNAASFQSFCVESNEAIHDNLNAWVSVADVDQSIPGSHAWLGGANTTTGDNLDPRTAYLYTQFAKGVLSNYQFSPSVARGDDSLQLQKAIWVIEDEANLASYDLKAKAWIEEAEAAIANQSWAGLGDVRIVQLYKWDGVTNGYVDVKQDQLYLVPAPAAVGLGLFGLGVVGVWLRRNAVAA